MAVQGCGMQGGLRNIFRENKHFLDERFRNSCAISGVIFAV